MTERWLPVPGFEGAYEVSDQGRVRSVDRLVIDSLGRHIRRKGRIRLQTCRVDGYYMVNLSAGNKVVMCYTHQLVAEAFIGPRRHGKDICHGDGVKANNAVSNLRYDFRIGNARDKRAHGTHICGERSNCAILNEDAVRAIRSSRRNAQILADKYGVAISTIKAARSRRTWKHVA